MRCEVIGTPISWASTGIRLLYGELTHIHSVAQNNRHIRTRFSIILQPELQSPYLKGFVTLTHWLMPTGFSLFDGPGSINGGNDSACIIKKKQLTSLLDKLLMDNWQCDLTNSSKKSLWSTEHCRIPIRKRNFYKQMPLLSNLPL